MLSKSVQARLFSSVSKPTKRVCMLAHSRQSDLQGSKIMAALQAVGGDKYNFDFYGYGG